MDIKEDFQEKFIKTEPGKIHYLLHEGGDTAVVFIHGLGVSMKTWTRLVPLLPSSITACLIDLLGHGESDAPKIQYSISLQVNALNEIIEKENLKEVYLFGHSYGGWVAVRYALLHPVKGLIIEDAAGLLSFYNGLGDAKAKAERTDWMLKSILLSDSNKYVMKNILEGQAARSEFITDDELKKLRLKTLILWGEDDALVNSKYAKEFADDIEGSKLAVMKGIGHTPHYASPNRVCDMLIEFLNSGK